MFFPFLSLYLRENAGLSGTQIGLVLATFPAVGLVAQPLWGILADRTGSRIRVLTAVTLAAGVGEAAVGLAHGFSAIILTVAGLAFFGSAVIPLSVSIAFAALSDRGPHAFGLARAWGTVGFLFSIVTMPMILDWWQAWHGLVRRPGGPSEPGLEIMFALAGMMFFVAALVASQLPHSESVALRAGRGDWRLLLRERSVVRVLAVGLVAYFFVQGPTGIFPLLIRDRGGDIDMVRGMWVAMLILEIPLIALAGTGLARIGARGLLTVGITVGGLRWFITGMVTDATLLYAVQLLHGVVVTGLLIGGPLYLEAVVPERLRSTAQSLFSMAGIGAGGLLSNLVAGWLVDVAGVTAPYIYGGIGATLLGLSVIWILPKPERLIEERA
jgi:PPP family 3-phenylpropionic acid transporter